MSRLTTRARRRRRACVLGVVTVAAVASLPGGAALAAPSQAGCESRTNNTYDKVLECVTGRRGPRAPGGAPGDRRCQRRDTGGRHDRILPRASTTSSSGWKRPAGTSSWTSSRSPSSRRRVLRQLTPVAATYATGAFTGTGAGDVTGNVIPVDINLTPPTRQHERLRGADFAGLDFSGAERHRADPARHLHLRRQGAQRRGRRRRGRDHLQPGQRLRRARASSSARWAARTSSTSRSSAPRSRTARAGPRRLDGAGPRRSRRRAGRRSTSSPSCRAPTTTTS